MWKKECWLIQKGEDKWKVCFEKTKDAWKDEGLRKNRLKLRRSGMHYLQRRLREG